MLRRGRMLKESGSGGEGVLGGGLAWVREFTDHRCGGQDIGRHAGTPQDGPAETPRVRRDVTMIFINHPSFSFGQTGKLHGQKLSCVRQGKIYLAKRQQS